MRIILIILFLLGSGLPAVEFPLSGTTVTGDKQVIDPVQRQHPTLLVFWASWCDVCMREIPALKKFHAAVGDKVDIISCTIDTDSEAAKVCAAQRQLPYPAILDGDMAIADRFAVEATPTLILLGVDGHELARGRSLGQLNHALAKLGIAQP